MGQAKCHVLGGCRYGQETEEIAVTTNQPEGREGAPNVSQEVDLDVRLAVGHS